MKLFLFLVRDSKFVSQLEQDCLSAQGLQYLMLLLITGLEELSMQVMREWTLSFRKNHATRLFTKIKIANETKLAKQFVLLMQNSSSMHTTCFNCHRGCIGQMRQALEMSDFHTTSGESGVVHVTHGYFQIHLHPTHMKLIPMTMDMGNRRYYWQIIQLHVTSHHITH